MLYTNALLGLCLAGYAQAHGGHEQQQRIPPDVDWATWHMAEEHHINLFDAASFFTLHDYDGSLEWGAQDLLKTYGLQDPSTDHISQKEKNEAVDKVIALFDRDGSGTISYAEFVIADGQGTKLPDLGYGQGHHGDDEYEYDLHHFERFHDENTKEEDLIHPEDIEHFRKHEQLEAQQEAQERMDRMAIVEANIPSKFRRG